MSTDPPQPISEDRGGPEPLLREAAVAYLGLVERLPNDETASIPYVVPMNFAYSGNLASLERGSPSRTTDDASGRGTETSPDAASDRSSPRLFFHTGRGRKTRALAGNPHVCLAITGGASFSPGRNPCEDGFDYRSALVWGKARLLQSRADRLAALRVIVAKYDPPAVERPFDEHDFAQTQVYEVTIDTVSYKERPRPHPA